MEIKSVRLCGSTWVYCDGMCNNCSRKYSVATNKTLFEINSKSALEDKYTEGKIAGAEYFCNKLKARIGIPGRYSGEYIVELADNILERMKNSNN